ncbi:MAG: hypothetical protein ACRD3J_11050, partial [Thermoanaerobaculia bacterium]
MTLFAASPAPFAWIDELGGTAVRNDAGQITSVDLSGTWVTDADLGALASLSSLTRINLAHTRISDQGLHQLRPLQNITDLNL